MPTPWMTHASTAESCPVIQAGSIPVKTSSAGVWDFNASDFSSARYSVRDILRQGFPDYLNTHQVPFHKEKTVRALMACGTGELGYTLCQCPGCDTVTMHADTCGSRSCPSCGYPRQQKWIEDRNADLLDDVPYVHVVFTLPHELNELIFQNQKDLLDLLFQAVKRSVLSLCLETYNRIPGLLMVLHTFSSDLGLHYHIHMLATAAGISPDKQTFSVFEKSGYFLPVELLSKRYRSNYMDGLEALFASGRLSLDGRLSRFRNTYERKELVQRCYAKEWNVEIRKYASHSTAAPSSGGTITAEGFPGYAIHPAVSPQNVHLSENTPGSSDKGSFYNAPGAEIVNEYLSEYAFRTAITDNRIVSWNDKVVVFKYKKYRNGKRIPCVMVLTIDKFIGRFLMHILEPGFQRIRYAGFLASCVRKKNLSLIRSLQSRDNPVEENRSERRLTMAELVERYTGRNPLECPACHMTMIVIARRVKDVSALEKVTGHCFTRD